MRRLFDTYLAVDWSARNTPSPAAPSRDALWVGEQCAAGLPAAETPGETYWRTRQACITYIRTRLLHHTQHGRRVFLGFDFPYGYPAGYAAALDLSGDASPWRRIWNTLSRLIVDHPDNSNNRFTVAAALNVQCGEPIPGPLWGCPVETRFPTLAPTSPGYPYPVRLGLALERLRQVDRLERGMQPIWKLYGNGSAGSQALVGIPALQRLRDDPALIDISLVWPFETGFTPLSIPDQGPFILHAEIWPGLVSDRLDPTLAIRDQAQVRAMVRWLAELDQDGKLATLFSAPTHLSSQALNECREEEGWTLGAGIPPMLHRAKKDSVDLYVKIKPQTNPHTLG
ncbi:MAG: cobalamin biosynthesis protein CbiG [Chloroflexota bacterium]|nr:cobalamin biosynthesis protein CbiG [Chloroflexota bacterium]